MPSNAARDVGRKRRARKQETHQKRLSGLEVTLVRACQACGLCGRSPPRGGQHPGCVPASMEVPCTGLPCLSHSASQPRGRWETASRVRA